MNGELLKQILSETGLKISGSFHARGVLVECPFSPITHESGTDSTPSLSLSINPNGVSLYYCFSCKCKGTLGKLARFLHEQGRLSDSAMEIVDKHEISRCFSIDEERSRWNKKTNGHKIYKQIPPGILKGKVPRYIIDRGVSIKTCREWGLAYDRDNSRCVFPVRSVSGSLVGLLGRSIEPGGAKYVAYPGFEKHKYLYGEHLLPEINPPRRIFLVEGNIDVLVLWQRGIKNVCATMGTTIYPEQMEKLAKFCKEVIVFFDNDSAGQGAALRVAKALTKVVKTRRVVKYYGHKDPKEMSLINLRRAFGTSEVVI